MPQTVILRGVSQRGLAHKLIDAAEDNSTVYIIDPDTTRTGQQNRTIHMWFGEIARQRGDTDALEVKGECHRKWGLTIRLRCPKFAWMWRRTGEHLSYEDQCKFLASGVLNVSSRMSVKEFGEYMDGMMRHFRGQGIHLTDPEALKYEREFQ